MSADPDHDAADPRALPPLAQALRVGFAFATVAVAALALVWLASGVTQVQPGTRAVVVRLGAIAEQHGPGLLLAWPRPIDRVAVVPGSDRPLQLAIDGDPSAAADGGDLLTGDAGLLRIGGAVIYHVADPAAYVLAVERAPRALRRAFVATVIAACAGRRLDETMAISGASEDDAARERRERFRTEVALALATRIEPLALGLAIDRVDLDLTLPERIQTAFEAVITAESDAAREVASVRTDVARSQQDALQKRQELLAGATAEARELLSRARVQVAPFLALTAEPDAQRRAAGAVRIYRERIAALLQRVAVVAIDASLPQPRLLLSGGS